MPRTVAIVLVSLCALAAGVRGDDGAANLRGDFDRAFTPLPVDRMFGDLDNELKLSRRAPYTDAARTEIDEARAKARLKREQLRNDRRVREAIVPRILAADAPLGFSLLTRAYGRLVADVDRARANLDRHLAALRIDVNPGVDPGGVHWERWLRDSEFPAARAVLADEEKLRDALFAGAGKQRTPDVRNWLASIAAKSDRHDERERAIRLLAGSGDPDDVAVLSRVLAGAAETWHRTMVLAAIADARPPAATPSVLAALAHPSWPVRSAAIAAVRRLGLRDAPAVDALLAAMESSEGRLRAEARDALCEATGRALGLLPGEWRLWWHGAKAAWVPPAAPAAVPPADEGLPRFFGIPTASRRIAFVVSRGKAMAEPARKRDKGDDGKPSPEPQVDTGLKVAAWELSETLARLPADVLWTVVVAGADPPLWKKELVPPTAENRQSAVRFLSKFQPEGRSNVGLAVEAALRVGAPAGPPDLALADAGDVDTVFVVGEAFASAGSLGGRESGTAAASRLFRLRRVQIHTITVGSGGRDLIDLAGASGGQSRGLSAP